MARSAFGSGTDFTNRVTVQKRLDHRSVGPALFVKTRGSPPDRICRDGANVSPPGLT
jgi:hypothetical protein